MKEKGIKLSVTATADRLEFSLSFVKQFEKEALEVLRAVMYEPHLKREDIELARRQLAVLRQQRRENPQQQLGELVRTEFYGPIRTGGRIFPTKRRWRRLRPKTSERICVPYGQSNLAAGISGDMDKAEAEAFLAQAFGGLTDKAAGRRGRRCRRLRRISGRKPRCVNRTFRRRVLFWRWHRAWRGWIRIFIPLYVANHIFRRGGTVVAPEPGRA